MRRSPMSCATLRNGSTVYMFGEKMKFVVAFAWLAIGMITFGQPLQALENVEKLRKQLSSYRENNERKILLEFFELLEMPNYAGNLADIRHNAGHIAEMLDRRGIESRILDIGKGSPAVFGELAAPAANTTVLFYIHYDGQPVVPKNWNTNPYTPAIKTGYEARGGEIVPFEGLDFPIDPEMRIFARSASDDKAPIIALLTAIDALRENGVVPSVNMKFFFHGAEERGSPYLSAMLEQFGGLLAADLMLFLDGPVHQSGRKKLSFGVRGIARFDLTVYGPDRPLHSGHYGNFAPSPIVMLSHLIASMRDEDGRILIDHFYEDVVPPTAIERAAIASLPDIRDPLMQELAIARQESPGMRYQEAILWPALNVKGIRAGEVGDVARNVIVPTATASFGYRLVPEQRLASLKRLTSAHLRSQGYHVVESAPDIAERRAHPKVVRLIWQETGYPSVRTAIDMPTSQTVIGIMRELGYPPLLVPSSGGSLPIWYFENVLNVPIIMLPIANYDNNQHAENENIRIQNLWDGIEIYGGLIARLGQE